MHNGMVELGSEKMAKSVGNIRLLHGALDQYGAETVLMWLVSGHYRQPLGFSEDTLEQAEASVGTLRELIRRLDPDAPVPEALDALAERFFDALADDFNTPEARSLLFDWVRDANRRLDAGETVGPGRLREMLHALGLERLADEADEEAPDEVRQLAERREAARSARDFAEADRLRDELAERGWEVRDTPDGARLVRSG
jgi:cysteinyl-tRNA synthetase